MQLELTELLVCPRCGPPHGLIAFVERMDGRRIVAGHVDCPICEDRHPVRDGAVWFGAVTGAPDGPDGRGTPDSGGAPVGTAADGSDGAATAAALLGAPASGETILFGPGAETFAAPVAILRPAARLVSFGRRPSPPHERVHSLVVVDPDERRRLPLRDQCLDGVVLRRDPAPWIAEAARVLRTGARLVVLEPGTVDFGIPPDAPLASLAADARAWVAART